VSQGFRSMCTFYRAKATEYKARADRAITLNEKRKFQNLERSFRKQWPNSPFGHV
jgi:hypothetical protein